MLRITFKLDIKYAIVIHILDKFPDKRGSLPYPQLSDGTITIQPHIMRPLANKLDLHLIEAHPIH